MKIVVIGGTGLIGSKLVARLVAQGHDAVSASPKSGVNSVTGEGLDRALQGADVVVDVSNAPDWSPEAVLAFFERSSRNLVAAGKAAGVKHHVALSIVGTDRMSDLAYFHAKVAQEQVIKTSGVPYTIVRATQFFEFVRSIADAGAVDGKVVVPSALFQPMAAADVAAALADVATQALLNATIDIAGPDKEPFASFVSRCLKAAGDVREVVADPKAGYFGAVIDDQSLTPLGQARLGAIHFDRWLTSAA
ncbi:SDR family oxidoreductase [Bradyrhizobium sp. SRS-191]|uniref:SDR family oxidoreductase n=1 Tax=Bradyrhizobium sp. SRS-191 TaxID=2962606 RepID=UPI00211EFA0A|nr:NAD(P)H-binding protein [Bradyrhizobium sp. SRS-191]